VFQREAFLLSAVQAHVEILGQYMVVLNSVMAAVELLHKKSSANSDRPCSPHGQRTFWLETHFVSSLYGNSFHWHVKNIRHVIGSRASSAEETTMVLLHYL
jgi:hypothetical protein